MQVVSLSVVKEPTSQTSLLRLERKAGSHYTYQGVLVQTVGRVCVRGEIRSGPEAVADGVIRVAVEVHADCRGGKLGAVVVQPFAGE